MKVGRRRFWYNKPMIRRPKNLNLLTIRFPLNAVVSIQHRISGMFLFLLLPCMLWGLQASLAGEVQFQTTLGVTRHWSFKLFLVWAAWGFFHHFYAGVRHLVQDVRGTGGLHTARISSRLVLALVAVSVAVFAWSLW